MFCSEFHWNGKKIAISYLFIIKINYVWFLTGKDRISMILHRLNYFFHVQCFCDCFLVKYPVSKKCINPTPLPHRHTNTKFFFFSRFFALDSITSAFVVRKAVMITYFHFLSKCELSIVLYSEFQ